MEKFNRSVLVWLWIGVALVFVQIVIGGITRLTGSGLSITKWEIVTGTIPPMNDAQWEQEFELYKSTPQYLKINRDFELRDFKFIYFWEYLHRLWARMMGFIFIIPFLYFRRKKYFKPWIYKDFAIVIGIASLAAIFGWIMVASGLINRPWVNAYKLSIHLLLGFSLFAYLLWTTLKYQYDRPQSFQKLSIAYIRPIIILCIFQLLLGGLMSGMKAALVFPTWPDMNGAIIPNVFFDAAAISYSSISQYDATPLYPAYVQFLHRLIAYIIVILAVLMWYKNKSKSKILSRSLLFFIGILMCQVIIGVFTLLYSKGYIPVGLGEMHQVGALFCIGYLVYLCFADTRKLLF